MPNPDSPDRPSSHWSVFAALGAAITASACCVLPLILVAFSVGGMWAGALRVLEPFRPLFTALAVGALGFALFRNHKVRQSDCVCETPGLARVQQGLLWIVALAVLGLIAAPPLIAWTSVAHTGEMTTVHHASLEEVVLDVQGMTCAACAAGVQATLQRIDGVEEARVTLDPPQAVLHVDLSKVNAEDLVAVIKRTGYQATRTHRALPLSGSTALDTNGPACRPPVHEQNVKLAKTAPPMTPINTTSLRTAFNAAADAVRVVSIVSPTCAVCVEGHEIIQQVFGHYDNAQLKAMMVWLPMRPTDEAAAATVQAATFKDPRLVAEGWDAEREIGRLFAQTLGLTRTAWDVYLVYEPGITWEGKQPPKPTYWMHQLDPDSGADQRYCLNPETLVRKVGSILEQARS